MITDQGRKEALGYWTANASAFVMGLYTQGGPVLESSTFAQLTEAAWMGYARVTLGTWSPVVLQPPNAVSVPMTQAPFSNTDVVDHTYTGWFLLDNSGVLVAGSSVDFPNAILPAGGTVRLYLSALLSGK